MCSQNQDTAGLWENDEDGDFKERDPPRLSIAGIVLSSFVVKDVPRVVPVPIVFTSALFLIRSAFSFAVCEMEGTPTVRAC